MMHRWLLAGWALAVHNPAVAAPEHPSVHRQQMEEFGLGRRRVVSLPPADPTPGPDVTVYGYLPYWADQLDTVPWDDLSHVALFAARVDTDGILSKTSRWGDIPAVLEWADRYDVRTHLTVVNFNTAELTVLLGSEAAKTRLIETLVDWVDETGVAGVNIDFEGLPASRREHMVAFVAALDEAIDEVVLATPAVDWSHAWDYQTLSQHAELFIMGYGYHWSGSTYAGPVDPLGGGGPWSKYSLTWTAEDYLEKGADPERVIMGLPLYGYSWPTANNEVPSPNLGSGKSIFWHAAQETAATHGLDVEPVSETPYTFDGTRQIWFGDVVSVQSRVQAMLGEGLGGVGVWALNYDRQDSALWAAISEETHFRPAVSNEDAVVSIDVDDEMGGAGTARVGCGCAVSSDPRYWLCGLGLLGLMGRRRSVSV
jgi:hypothetical protein